MKREHHRRAKGKGEEERGIKEDDTVELEKRNGCFHEQNKSRIILERARAWGVCCNCTDG